MFFNAQVLAERHSPIQPHYNDTRSGVTLTVDGITFTPEELVAMVLTHAVDIAVAHATSQGSNQLTRSPPKDVVLTVPSFATQHERRALLDAAYLAGLTVLDLVDENTAAAVQYAMDKTFEEDKDQIMVFYNMGASSLQVSLIRLYAYPKPEKYGKPKIVPAVQILYKAWDATLGGDAFDHLIVEYLADQFNLAWYKTGRASKEKGDDVRKHPRAMTKLRLQANKVKHVLSANTEFPVYLDAVHDDVALATHVTRSLLEELAAPLWERAIQPVHDVLSATNLTLANITGVELLGGGMRIPRLQLELQNALSNHSHLELGLHMNADEAMALGAAFVGANVSTAFRVRHVGLTDINPFPLQVSLTNLPTVNATDTVSDDDGWNKSAVVFPSFGKTGVKRTITFTHDRDVHCALDYLPGPPLPDGTPTAVERYNVSGVSSFARDMIAKNLTATKPKVSLQFELGTSGVAGLVRAEASMEETYMVEEEIEVVDEEALANASAAAAAAAEAANGTSSAGAASNATSAASNATVAAPNATTEAVNATASNGTEAANATTNATQSKVKPPKKPTKKILVPKVRFHVRFRVVRLVREHSGCHRCLID